MLVFLLLASVATAANELPGAAARSLSEQSVAGLRLAVKNDPGAGRKFSDCVMSIDGGSMAPAYEAYLRSTLTQEELDEMNAFSGSDPGGRYSLYARELFYRSKGAVIDGPIQFSRAEITAINRFVSSSTGQKYLWITDVANKEASEVTRRATQDAIESCRNGG